VQHVTATVFKGQDTGLAKPGKHLFAAKLLSGQIRKNRRIGPKPHRGFEMGNAEFILPLRGFSTCIDR